MWLRAHLLDLTLPLAVGLTAILGLAVPALGSPRAKNGDRSSSMALPGPAPRGHAQVDPEVANRACADCHQDIAREWQGSMHRTAYVDPIFQEALALEPFGFCRGCHAPESDPKKDPSKAAASVGVGCTTCHVEGKDVVGPKGSEHAGERHAVLGDPRMSDVDACASCHQFDFPATPGMPMQNTVREHDASSASALSCQSCHMKTVVDAAGKKHTNHTFSVIGDPAMIRSAASAAASMVSTRELLVTISPGSVGHAFPTGDMFRRLEIRAEAVDNEGRVVRSAPVVHLARSFADHASSVTEADFSRIEVADTRIPAPGTGDGRKVRLRFDRPVDGLSVRWSVVYQRMGTAMAASFGLAQAHDEIVVAEGYLGARPADLTKGAASTAKQDKDVTASKLQVP